MTLARISSTSDCRGARGFAEATGAVSAVASSGGTRTVWPAASRTAAFARPPSTRVWPVRSSFSTRPWLRAGENPLNPPSSRVSASSAATSISRTPYPAVAAGGASGYIVRFLLFVAQALPIVQTLANLALEAAVDRLVEGLARQAVGEIVLTGEAVLGIRVVAIAGTVALLLHELGRRVQDMLRRHQRAGRLARPHPPPERPVDAHRSRCRP